MEILNENGKTYLKGIMTEANFGKNPQGIDFSFRGRNGNGRAYPFEYLKSATLNLIEELKKSGFIYSYLGHPNHGNLVESESAGKLVEIIWDDNSGRAYTKVEILENTKDGKYVLKCISEGKPFGISTRGSGSLSEDKIVQSDLMFITADIIKQFDGSYQSCQSCSLSLHESIQNNYKDFLIESDCGCIYAKLAGDDKKQAETYLIESFKSCLNKIKNK